MERERIFNLLNTVKFIKYYNLLNTVKYCK